MLKRARNFLCFRRSFIPLIVASIAPLPIPQLLIATSLLRPVRYLYAFTIFRPPRRPQHAWRQLVEVVRYPGLLLFTVLLFGNRGNENVIGG